MQCEIASLQTVQWRSFWKGSPAKPKIWEEMRTKNRGRMDQEIIECPHRSLPTTSPSGLLLSLQIWPSLVAQMVKHLPTMRETRVQSLGREDLLEKEMATHSSILAWKIPRVEKPSRLQSMASERVKHDWESNTTEWLHFSLCCTASQVALEVENPPANAGDTRDVGLISESGRSPGEGHGNALQYSCLENPMDRGTW